MKFEINNNKGEYIDIPNEIIFKHYDDFKHQDKESVKYYFTLINKKYIIKMSCGYDTFMEEMYFHIILVDGSVEPEYKGVISFVAPNKDKFDQLLRVHKLKIISDSDA